MFDIRAWNPTVACHWPLQSIPNDTISIADFREASLRAAKGLIYIEADVQWEHASNMSALETPLLAKHEKKTVKQNGFCAPQGELFSQDILHKWVRKWLFEKFFLVNILFFI